MDDTTVGTTVAHAIADGKAMADDGDAYESAQDAVDAAQNWVWLPPNTTFNEAVDINTADFHIRGSGYTTVVEPQSGSEDDAFNIQANNVTLQNLRARTNADGSGEKSTRLSANGGVVSGCWLEGSGSMAYLSGGTDNKVINCVGYSNNDNAIRVTSSPAPYSVIGNIITDADNRGIEADGQDGIVAYNIVLGTGNNGIFTTGSDIICIGNRVHNITGNGIDSGFGADVIIANNRISNSSDSDLQFRNNGVNDSNLTGGAN